jgi:hypothetical protein
MDPLPWLLEDDPANPGVRYFALRDLLGRPEDDPEVQQARRAVMSQGPVPQILAHQNPDGSWTPRGGGYQGTGFQLELLAELGAGPASALAQTARTDALAQTARTNAGGWRDPVEEGVRRAGQHVLEHTLAVNQAFSYVTPPVPSKTVHCHNAMQARALLRLGFGGDFRLQAAIEWQARMVTGDLLPGQRYYKSATAGPNFACALNQGQPCAWGATKALRAFLAVPAAQRSPAVQAALQAGAEFLLSYDLAQANYPYTGKVSNHWFNLAFPLSYWSDMLETAGVLVEAGYQDDPRLKGALDWLRQKQDLQGRWRLEDSLNGKMWVDIEVRGRPSKWVTLRALRLFK